MEQTAEQVAAVVDGDRSAAAAAPAAAPAAARRRVPYAGSLRFGRLRSRWLLVVAAACLGAVLAFALSSGPATYESTATVRLSDSSGDSNRIKQIAQTIEVTATSGPVMERATEGTGVDPRDLATRTTASWQTDTDVILISVRGADSDQVVDEADAIVAALGAVYDQQTSDAIAELSRQGDRLLAAGQLENDAAESARQQGVGSVVATEQGAAATGYTTVQQLEPAQEAAVTGISTPVAIVLGAFVGAALAAAAALLLPFRRRQVRRVGDVPVMLPGARAVRSDESGAAELVGRLMTSGRSDLAVVAMGDVADEALYFASDITILLRAHGTAATILDATDVRPPDRGPGEVRPRSRRRSEGSAGPTRAEAARGTGATQVATADRVGRRSSGPHTDLTTFQFLGRSGRQEDRRRHGVATLVVVTTARPEPLSLLAGQPDLITAVAVRSGRQRSEDVQAVLDQLHATDPTVVLLP